MIVVDTSIWIDHLHRTEPTLVDLLSDSLVAGHPMVIGELALGTLANRDEFLSSLKGLPSLPSPDSDEVLRLIDSRNLHGRGLGLVDVTLLASALLSPGTQIWTRDKRLASAADSLGVGSDRA